MARQKLIYNNEFPNGKLIDFTPEEETARDTAEKAWSDGELDRRLKFLRKERNGLLKETDYYALADVTLSDKMKKYRQDLRDLPTGLDTVDKVKNVTFPTKPSEE